MTAKALQELCAVIDRLEPDVWLEFNRVSFPRYFGIALGTGQASKAAHDLVSAFAKRNNLILIFDGEGQVVRFSRANDKQSADV
jgi:hypothetical protein